MQHFERNEAVLQGEKDALDKRENSFGVNATMLYLLGGTTQVRILPPYSDKGVFFKEISKHRVKPGKRWETFACPLEMEHQPCALCELGNELKDSLEPDKIKYADNLKPQTKYLYNVICMGGPQNSKNEMPEFGKVYCLEGGMMVHKGIIQLDQDPADGWADVTTLNNGVNLSIKRTGQGLGTEYHVNPHGSGRTDIFAHLTERGIDPAALTLFDLDNVYDMPTEEKLVEAATLMRAQAPKAITVQAQPIPTAAPVAQPVAAPVAQPAAAAVAAPAAPVAAAPVAQSIAAAAPVAAAADAPAPPAIPAPPTE